MIIFYLEKLTIPCKLYCEAYARCPRKAHQNSGGYDLFATESRVLRAGERGLMRVDLQMAIPEGYYGIIAGRSGLADSRGVVTFPGTIDSDYRGIVCVILFNFGKDCYKVKIGSRIAQKIISKCDDVTFLLYLLTTKDKDCIFNFELMLGIRFFMKKSAKEFHFAILDLYFKILYKGSLYCFCNEYSGCEDFCWRKGYCPICRVLIDLHDTEKLCDYAQFNFGRLCEIADSFYPYLEECFEVMCTADLMELFSSYQHSTYPRGNYTGTKTELTLEEEIAFTTKLKRLNGEARYLKNMYE